MSSPPIFGFAFFDFLKYAAKNICKKMNFQLQNCAIYLVYNINSLIFSKVLIMRCLLRRNNLDESIRYYDTYQRECRFPIEHRSEPFRISMSSAGHESWVNVLLFGFAVNSPYARFYEYACTHFG